MPKFSELPLCLECGEPIDDVDTGACPYCLATLESDYDDIIAADDYEPDNLSLSLIE